ncbi:hypothetical protein HAHE_30500 [Haloferula helveola]|uniref:Protein SirB1 N-terminal domain-containing protein n=1 Tax=Haloferula helveola TaxID=490095 RepID=A0ABN6H882_9BACT|nr:hypothetical protein HAHE_30500 [Haloferula helveola]
MPGLSPTPDHLAVLLRLLDDETPEVRESLEEAFAPFGGDVSELLGDSPVRLSDQELETLSELLLPARRRRLRREWIVPVAGLPALEEDWDRFESMLRMLSDYLHDGVALRQPLGDAIDLLAEDTEEAFYRGGAPAVVSRLLGERIIRTDPRGEFDARHLELAAVAAGAPSNAVGCGLVTLLVARRLGASISAINLPGAFFLSVEGNDGPTVLDPGSRGVPIEEEEFRHRIRRYPKEIQLLAHRPATPGELLLRVTEELATCFAVNEQDDDARLMEELVVSLIGQA